MASTLFSNWQGEKASLHIFNESQDKLLRARSKLHSTSGIKFVFDNEMHRMSWLSLLKFDKFLNSYVESPSTIFPFRAICQRFEQFVGELTCVGVVWMTSIKLNEECSASTASTKWSILLMTCFPLDFCWYTLLCVSQLQVIVKRSLVLATDSRKSVPYKLAFISLDDNLKTWHRPCHAEGKYPNQSVLDIHVYH